MPLGIFEKARQSKATEGRKAIRFVMPHLNFELDHPKTPLAYTGCSRRSDQCSYVGKLGRTRPLIVLRQSGFRQHA